jgi:DeoR/GlpR family transcriptional regulator of sugar metabolism
MRRSKRHNEILRLAARDGEVRSRDLAERFGVDAVTVRRDLAQLQAEGSVQRVHGGAIPSQAGRAEFDFGRKQQTHAAEKQAIARAAAEMVRPGMTLTLDTGSTTLAVARRLAGTADLKVLTSSLAIAAALYPHAGVELILLGGVVRRGSPDLCGMLTVANLSRFRVDLAIVGADAAGPDGLYTTHMDIADVSRAILAGAERSLLVADSSKFQARAFVRFAGWPDIDTVVTDCALAGEPRRWLEEAAVRVVCAGAPRGET